MSDVQARRFFEFLLADDAEDLGCTSVMVVLHRYVELSVGGRPMDVFMPGVAAHLAECEPCADQYDTLRELALLEAEDRLPSVASLWRALQSGMGPSASAAAGGAIAGATSPTRPVPVPSGAAVQAATNRKRSSVPIQGRLGLVADRWLPLAAALAVVLLGLGWYRSDRSERHYASTVSALEDTSQMRMERSPAGAWAKVFFRPASDQMVVQAGGLPRIEAGEQIECWLKRLNGQSLLAAAFKHVNPDSDWWVIDAEQAAQDYEALTLVVNNDGHTTSLVEVPLTVAPGR